MALLKGASTTCTRRFHEWRTNHHHPAAHGAGQGAGLVRHDETGDAAELPFFNNASRRSGGAFWGRRHGVRAERCGRPLGAAYGLPDADFYLEGEAPPSRAHTSSSTALLLADLAAEGPRAALRAPGRRRAHRLEEAATDQLTYRVEWSDASAALSAGWRVEAIWQRTCTAAPPDAGSSPLLEAGAALATGTTHEPASRRLCGVAGHLCARSQRLSQRRGLRATSGARRQGAQPAAVEARWRSSGTAPADALCARWGGTRRRHRDHGSRALGEDERTVSPGPSARRGGDLGMNRPASGRLCWPRRDGIGRLDGRWVTTPRWSRAGAAPIRCRRWWSRVSCWRGAAPIFTGATLRTGSGFNYLRERWAVGCQGLHGGEPSITSAMCCPRPAITPRPTTGAISSSWEQAVADAPAAARQAARWHFHLLPAGAGHGRCHPHAAGRSGVTVLQHGQSSRSRLLREFHCASEQAVLLARSFWKGRSAGRRGALACSLRDCPCRAERIPSCARAAPSSRSLQRLVAWCPMRCCRPARALVGSSAAGDRGGRAVDSRAWCKQYGQAFLTRRSTVRLRAVSPIWRAPSKMVQSRYAGGEPTAFAGAKPAAPSAAPPDTAADGRDKQHDQVANCSATRGCCWRLPACLGAAHRRCAAANFRPASRMSWPRRSLARRPPPRRSVRPTINCAARPLRCAVQPGLPVLLVAAFFVLLVQSANAILLCCALSPVARRADQSSQPGGEPVPVSLPVRVALAALPSGRAGWLSPPRVEAEPLLGRAD